MKRYLSLFSATLCCFVFTTFTAYAEIDWGDNAFQTLDSNVKSVKTNVSTVTEKVTGNISTVADEFKEQVDILQANGFMLKESAEQLLKWLNSHKDDYLEFAGNERCRAGDGSPCDMFRDQLRTFLQDFSLLSDRFPIIERVGLSDAPLLTRMLDRLPAILLLPMYEAMNRIPDWGEIPAQLADIYDEIGDPDVFSVRLSPLPDTESFGFATSSFTTTALNGPSWRFCERQGDRLDNGIDPVRLNRIKLFVSSIKSGFTIVAEFMPEDQSLDLFGEGASVKVPAGPALKAVAEVIGFILEAVDTFHSNLDICAAERDREFQIEVQLAQCLQLADFVLPVTRDDLYDFVVRKVESAGVDGVSVDKSERAIGSAESFRDAEQWKSAYLKLCEAYQKIGN